MADWQIYLALIAGVLALPIVAAIIGVSALEAGRQFRLHGFNLKRGE